MRHGNDMEASMRIRRQVWVCRLQHAFADRNGEDWEAQALSCGNTCYTERA